MVKEALTVITYDMADNKRRRNLVRVLEGWGFRVQESVFEAWLTPAERGKMIRSIHKCLKLTEDRLAVYVLPAADYKDIATIGAALRVTNDKNWIV